MKWGWESGFILYAVTVTPANIFYGRGGFVELGHFEKHFVKNTRKKAPHGKFLEFFQKRVKEASPLSSPTPPRSSAYPLIVRLSQHVSGLMLKKKSLSVINELVETWTIYFFTVILDFFCYRKKLPSCCLNETSQSLKYCLKTFLSHKNCESSVEVNGTIDAIYWYFMGQNATNVYYTKKKLPSIYRILHSLKF